MSRPKGWQDKPDRYEWIKAFLSQRGRLRVAQRIMAVVCGSAALAPLTVLFTQHRPGAGAIVIGAVTAVFSIGTTTFYLTRWPTRQQSEAAVLIGVLCIGGWSFIQPTAALSALACTPTAVTAAHSAIFHRRRIVLFHGVASAAIAIAAVAQLVGEVSVAAAVSAFWLINFVNVSVLLGAWGMSRAMGGYRQRSEEDSLTGLLNRCAFTEVVSRQRNVCRQTQRREPGSSHRDHVNPLLDSSYRPLSAQLCAERGGIAHIAGAIDRVRGVDQVSDF